MQAIRAVRLRERRRRAVGPGGGAVGVGAGGRRGLLAAELFAEFLKDNAVAHAGSVGLGDVDQVLLAGVGEGQEVAVLEQDVDALAAVVEKVEVGDGKGVEGDVLHVQGRLA